MPVQVRVTTAKAVYAVSKAAPAYRAIFDHLAEAVAVTLHCFLALAPASGGSSQASLSEVVAKLARAKVRCILELYMAPTLQLSFVSHQCLMSAP